MNFAASILNLIGNTPLIRIPDTLTGCRATVLCKLEWTNPGGSIQRPVDQVRHQYAGTRYITKLFSDDWMRQYNFKLEEDVIVHV